MLQNVWKFIIFIGCHEKYTLIPFPKLPFVRIHGALRYFIIKELIQKSENIKV